MGARIGRPVTSASHNLRVEPCRFTANGSSAVASSTYRGPISSVSRTGVGTFSVTLKESYPSFYAVLPQATTTAATRVILKSHSVSSGTLVLETRQTSQSAGQTPAYVTGVTVTSHVATYTTTGYILMAQATTATSAGPKTIVSTGTPSAGQVKVTYASGIATLTFNTSDAVTAATILVVPTGPSADWSTGLAVSSNVYAFATAGYVAAVQATTGGTTGPEVIVSTGTPSTGQCKVTYASGVPTLTFAAGDTVSVTSALFIPAATVSEPLVDTSEVISFCLLASESNLRIR